MKKTWLINTGAVFFLVILGLVLYTLTLKGVKGNIPSNSIKKNLDQVTKPLELSPERGRFILTKSLAENGTFALSPELANAADPDVGYYQGKYFIYFPPGVSMLALPFYIIGSRYELAQVATFAMVSLFAIFNLILIFIIARNIFRLPAHFSLFSAIIFGFATNAWSYAVTLYQHHITTFFILYTFYAVWRYKQSGRHNWIWAVSIWSIIGYSLFVDYPNAFLLLPNIVYFFFSSLSITKLKNKFVVSFNNIFLISSVAFFALIAAHGYYNYVNFGDWSRVSGSLLSIKTVKKVSQSTINKIEENVTAADSRKRVVGFFKEEDAPEGFAVLLFSIDRGLFLYAPIFVLALFGIYSLWSKINLEAAVLLGTLGVNLFLYSSWGDPWGGWAFGPRYLIPSMSILAIFIGVWLTNLRFKITGYLTAFLLFAYSSFIALLGVLTTNQVPPKIEADFLKMKYNFLLNLDHFTNGNSSSFFFNEYGSKNVSLMQYFLLIYVSLLLISFFLLFVTPLFASPSGKISEDGKNKTGNNSN